jgi:hypothetical protein
MNTRFVVISCKTFKYQVFEGKQCIAEFEETAKNYLTAEMIEKLRTDKYTAA